MSLKILFLAATLHYRKIIELWGMSARRAVQFQLPDLVHRF
jgi:hypothetical protein